ncbi:MAG: nucleotide exchange factor GrpE [Actinomycetota bacterium]
MTKKRSSKDIGKDGRQLAEVSAEVHDEVLRERDEYLESLQRLKAEFENFRKRVARENRELSQRASQEVINEVLPVLDNFERALKAVAEHDEQVLGEGVELVYNQLRDVLNRRGLCEIEAEGEDFDPSRHEAVLCKPSPEHVEGKVIEVLEKGYQVDDRVVRPAKVVVSSSSETDSKKTAGASIEPQQKNDSSAG